MSISWEKLSSESILEHPRLKLSEDRVRLPDGTETDYLVIRDYPDYPTVIPVRDDGMIMMLREHAYPINEELFQFPEGDKNPKESIEQAAARELAEETGFVASDLQHIGTNLMWHRRTTARCNVFVAKALTESPDRPSGDLEEQGMTLHWLTEKEIWKMIAGGEIIQKNALAAWSIYQAMQLSS